MKSQQDRPLTRPRQEIHDELVQSLLHSLEKDLSDLPNLSDIRIRFIPRQALVNIITREQVARLLEQLPIEEIERNFPLQDVARYISPPPSGCHCQREGCTGTRMILAVLLLIGRKDLIATVLPSQALCDQDLPFGTTKPGASSSATQKHQNGSSGAANGTITALFRLLSPIESNLWAY